MTERTLSGNVRRRPGPRKAGRRRLGKPDALPANFSALRWTGLMLMSSLALAAAAVFTHRPL
jgi:hypothetical protein